MKIEYRDDPTLPCSGCVNVEDENDSADPDDWTLRDAWGQQVDALYSRLHTSCEAAIAAYTEDCRKDPT